QHHAVIVEQGVAFLEERVVEADADMLEHSDRDDAIEFLRHVAIVLQTELDLVGQSLFARTHARERKLALGQRDTGDAHLAKLGEVAREPAPAAADVERPPIRAEEKLGGQMALFTELDILARLVGGLAVTPP